MPKAESLEDFVGLAEEARAQIMEEKDADPVTVVERVYQLWWHWADFEIVVISPTIGSIFPPIIHTPELLPNSRDYEFVYNISDYGYKLLTSKGEDMYSAGKSMCKLFYTIEKMMVILIDRLKEGGINSETEVQVSFGGHELAQRKAFEIIINLSNYNLVVTNFDPEAWGERYLQIIKRMAEKGLGYWPEAPRDIYRKSHGSSSPKFSG